MTQFLWGEYFVYLSLCNPQKALATIEAWMFSSVSDHSYHPQIPLGYPFHTCTLIELIFCRAAHAFCKITSPQNISLDALHRTVWLWCRNSNEQKWMAHFHLTAGRGEGAFRLNILFNLFSNNYFFVFSWQKKFFCCKAVIQV